MLKELKVYNRFDELILYLRLVPGSFFPIHIVLGSPELREAIHSLYGQDFDRSVVVNGQHRRFVASWASSEYIDALAGYWASNFRWRTEIRTDGRPVEDRVRQSDICTQSLGLGGGSANQLPLAGGVAYPYSNGLVTESNFLRVSDIWTSASPQSINRQPQAA